MAELVKDLRKKLRWKLATPAQRRHSLVGPIRDWRKKREFQIRFLKSVGLQPEHYLMDVGCGTLRGGIPIIEYLNSGHYFGLESRKEVLLEARRELEDHRLERKQPSLIHSPSLEDVSLEQRFDFVWAFSVLIHMTDDILDSCLRLVERHLKMSGAFFANVNIGKKPDGHWEGYPVVFRLPSFYQEAAGKSGLNAEDLGVSRIFRELGIRSLDEQHMLKFTRLASDS